MRGCQYGGEGGRRPDFPGLRERVKRGVARLALAVSDDTLDILSFCERGLSLPAGRGLAVGRGRILYISIYISIYIHIHLYSYTFV